MKFLLILFFLGITEASFFPTWISHERKYSCFYLFRLIDDSIELLMLMFSLWTSETLDFR